MAGTKSTNREIDQTKAQVAALWARGQSTAKIATAVGKSERQVRRYVEALREAWRESITSHDDIRLQQLAELSEIKEEAWSAWGKSKDEQRTATVETKGPQEGGNGAGGRRRGQALSRISTQTNPGEAKYLQLLLDAIDAQNKLLGLVVIKHAETDSRGNDRPALTEEERTARVLAILDAARARRTGGAAHSTNDGADVVSESGAADGSPTDPSG